MASPPTPLFAAPIRHLLGVAAALAGGWLGLLAGEALAYRIATWTDRDIVELKDMLIWSAFGGGLTGLLAGVWLALTCTRCSVEARRISLIGAAAVVGVGAMMLASFDWPKSAGTPNVMYEIRLPAGTPLPRRDKIDVKLWTENSGSGCYVADLRKDGNRPVIAGRFLLNGESGDRTMSLRLDRGPEGYWTMPVRADAKLDKTFGP